MDILEFQGLNESEQWEEFSLHCVLPPKYEDIGFP